MTNPAIKDKKNNEVPEGIMDAFLLYVLPFMTLSVMEFIKTLRQKYLYCKTKNAWTRRSSIYL